MDFIEYCAFLFPDLLKRQIFPEFIQILADFIESALKLDLNLKLTREENRTTNLNWLLGGRPVIGEVGVVGLVHHLAAHTQVTFHSVSLSWSPLWNSSPPVYPLSPAFGCSSLDKVDLKPPLTQALALSPFPAM